MWRNYLITAFRALNRYRGYSTLHVTGLTIGVTAFLLISAYCLHELGYDQYHTRKDRIYRVWREFLNQDGTTNLRLGSIAYPFAPLLQKDFPQFEEVVQLAPEYQPLISHDDHSFIEERFFWTDERFFKVFDVQWIAGQPSAALAQPNSVVITRSTARKYFGDGPAFGRTILMDKEHALKITGIIEDFPAQSSLQMDLLGSASSVPDFKDPQVMQNFGGNNFPTFVLMRENTYPDAILPQMQDFFDRYIPDFNSVKLSRLTRLHFQPLTDVHLRSAMLNSDAWENRDIQTVYILMAVALFVLLVACVNYINLATARSARRSREIGMRKTLGASFQNIRQQFLSEALLLATISVVLALGLVELLLPKFNSFVGVSVTFSVFSWPTLGAMAFLTILLTLLAGWYPALYLARLNPLTALKSQTAVRTRTPLRSGLVILQFAISITLIIAMGVVFRQLQYVKSKDLGITREPVVVMTASDNMIHALESFKHKLYENPSITGVTAAKRFPSGRLLDGGTTRMPRGNEVVTLPFRIGSLNVDHDYVTTFGLQLVAGRNFDKNLASDSTKAFIYNECAVRKMGFASAQEAIGQAISVSGRDGFIVGVVKDFHFESLQNEISPIVMRIVPDLPRIAVRMKRGNMPETIGFLKSVWSEWRSDYPFDYYFVDDQFARSYKQEEELGTLFGIFSGLAIIIACLGLLGLVAFIAEQRTKEIGIRKVLGATVTQILLLIAKEFIIYVCVAGIVASLIAGWLMDQWLGHFAYRTTVEIGVILIAIGGAVVVTLLTISIQAFRTATANPVHALQYE